MRDEHGGDIARITAELAQAPLDGPARQAAVDENERLAELDEQRVAAAAATERCEAQLAGPPAYSDEPPLPPPGGA